MLTFLASSWNIFRIWNLSSFEGWDLKESLCLILQSPPRCVLFPWTHVCRHQHHNLQVMTQMPELQIHVVGKPWHLGFSIRASWERTGPVNWMSILQWFTLLSRPWGSETPVTCSPELLWSVCVCERHWQQPGYEWPRSSAESHSLEVLLPYGSDSVLLPGKF